MKESARGFLKAARKDLTPEEAASTAGLRWLQYEAERLDQDCASLKTEMRELRHAHDALLSQYNDGRVEIERLTGLNRVKIRNEILSTLCIGAGGAGLGASPSLFIIPDATKFGQVGLVISGVLFMSGVILRIWK